MPAIDALRYPIGHFVPGRTYTEADTQAQLTIIRDLPVRLTALVGDWLDARLDTPYRPDGWTVRQLVHHVADSHVNAYVRTKLTLTEDNPTVKPYEEAEWAKLPDNQLPIAPSLTLLTVLHHRWVTILASLTDAELTRTYVHPATGRTYPLREVIALYAWHSEHHFQHANQLAERNGWAGKNV